MDVDAVFFDMDGVVVDSERHWMALEAELFADLLGPGVVDVERVAGMQYEEIYDWLVEAHGLDLAREDFLAEYETAAAGVYGERAELMPGFVELVGDLRVAGVTVGLVSAAPHDWIDMVVERFGLGDEFAVRVSADDVDGPSKPDPGIYADAAERVGVDPAACIAVEDSTHGVAAAHRAGMTSVAYRVVHNREMDFEAAGADVVVDGPDELGDYLRNAVGVTDTGENEEEA